ncbi:ribonuclease T(2) [Pseudomonas sp. CAN2814]|uniref:ribonuclease T2 family protein n=1 Tax=Pseudomonas sp. CAN1 TaxID=3046726 RepID=UPI002647C229|nr:ribonuclease T(2) [Pseudomonas sp. CAN1]MDN6857431.1 ribonuclease T(2) [Pseudomonas sp. CAN1]
MKRAAGLLLALSLACATQAPALEATQGTFEVSTRCEAFQSFKKGTNPGALSVEPGQSYRIVEVNKADYQWLRLQLPGDGNPLRWVAASCGTPHDLVVAGASGKQDRGAAAQCRTADTYDSYVLALSWQPGFCEHSANGAAKPECQAMGSGKLGIRNFTLHGLWPNRSECGKRYGDCGGADLQLSASTLDYIKPWMPNFYFSTQLGNHEWKKHGVCQTAMGDDEYFRFAVDLVKSFNDSPAGTYVREQSGGAISRQAFYAKWDEEFGSQQAANNVLLLCSGDYLQEIRITLPRDLKGARSVRQIIGSDFATQPAQDRKECRAERILIESPGTAASQ